MEAKSKIKDQPEEVAPEPVAERNLLLVAAEDEVKRLALVLTSLRQQRDNHNKAVKERQAEERVVTIQLATAIRELAPAVTQAERAATNLRKIYEGKQS